MKRIQQLIGGAGTGKTTRNMQFIAELVADHVDPMEILFSSFTRAARQTAAVRAEDITGVPATELMGNGWFKTLQAVCYKCLGVKSEQMITDRKSSRDWLSNLFDSDFSKVSVESEDGFVVDDESNNDVAKVLQEWSTARMMMLTPEHDNWPVKSMEHAKAIGIIERYERQKYLDEKLDFADLALKFVGLRHNIHSMKIVAPECDVPDVSACILDEYQDTPELLHMVAMRIASSPKVQSVFVAGDPFQSIFSFIGSDNRFLMNGFNYTDSETMKTSYRCSRKILNFGEDIIRKCSDYFDRGIRPKESDGELLRYTSRPNGWVPSATEDWLVVARTNRAVAQMTKWLTAHNTPWVSSDGDGSGYVGPRKRRTGEIFYRIKHNKPVSSSEWAYAIADIPVSHAGKPFLKRGVKSAALSSDWHCPSEMLPTDLLTNGATEHLVDAIKHQDWGIFDPAFSRFARVVDAHGIDIAVNPKIRAGTIHSVKGDEADNTLLFAKSSQVVRRSPATQRVVNEELRMWYVGATRARDTLVLFRFNAIDGWSV